ncbi:MAG: glycosyltransferase [Bacteriovoracaceae bacterium]|nr:glycosyltransferase [Bacteriovoracaceae bacterium]
MENFFKSFIFLFGNFVVIYFISLNSVYLLLLILSTPQVFRRNQELEIEEDDLFFQNKPFPPVTIIAPAYNEGPIIKDSLTYMLNLKYPEYEVVVVNDGSKDNTLQEVIDNFELYEVPPAFQVKIKSKPIKGFYKSRKYPNLLVIDKENGGKADSLNAGINASQYAYFLALDADTLIAEDALYRAISPMITQKNVIATGGTVGVINDCLFEDGKVLEVRFPRSYYAGIQVIEYIRAYLFGRVGWNWLGGNMVISGAFGLFNKHIVLENGGYLTGTVGEDLELTLKLHNSQLAKERRYKIVSIPDTVCWTEVPEDKKTLSRQRERWHRGLIDSLYRHKEMFLNPKYGITGLFTFPFFVFGELLSPFIELLGWIAFPLGLYLGVINLNFFFLFILASVGLSVLLTFASILLAQVSLGRYHSEKDFFKMFLYTILENFGYRQMTVIWRIKGIIQYFQGNQSWGEMKRIGVTKK